MLANLHSLAPQIFLKKSQRILRLYELVQSRILAPAGPMDFRVNLRGFSPTSTFDTIFFECTSAPFDWWLDHKVWDSFLATQLICLRLGIRAFFGFLVPDCTIKNNLAKKHLKKCQKNWMKSPKYF